MDSKESPTSPEKNRGNSVSFPLVWVLSEDDGRQEPALLLEEYDEMHLIEWKTTGEREFVESHRICRRRKRGMGSWEKSTSSSKASLKHASERATPADATTQNPVAAASMDDGRDDDEVEVLLTIMPQFPAKASLSNTITPVPPLASSTLRGSGEPLAEIEDYQHSSPRTITDGDPLNEPSEENNTEENNALNRTLWAEPASSNASGASSLKDDANTFFAPRCPTINFKVNHAQSQMPTADPESFGGQTDSEYIIGTSAATSVQPHFSSRSSAYLQSLAEICHTILWDVRWRVGGKRQERLLTWERKADLSAVHALARRYLPLPRLSPVSKCKCLFCFPSPCDSDQKIGDEVSVKETSDETNDDGVDDEASDEESNADDRALPDNRATVDDGEEAFDRCLNLYARLSSRKGPWFRVDDLFKYYIPKRTRKDGQEYPGGVSPKSPSPIKVLSPSKFFLPASAKGSLPSRKKKEEKFTDFYIDQEYVNAQLEAVTTLLADIQRLYSMGLTRSFQDEQECGLITGQIQKYGLLRQEEQRVVLAKLGGARRKQAPRRSSSGTSPSSWDKHKSSSLGENLIWKQMCQQQSILAGRTTTPSNDQSSTVLLPVAKHVDQALVSSWASSLVLRASLKDYVPQHVLRSMTIPVNQILQQLLKDYVGDERRGISLTCLRLREAPLESVRRCCRLYLCATSGPGDMRGDTGNNAWKSLPLEAASKSDAQLPPSLVVSPPGSQCWHHTVFPNRDFRFRLTSCFFQRAHRPLLLLEGDDNFYLASDKSEEALWKIQVYPSVASFELWELTVDFRATVDYLMDANALALYNERKRVREAEDEYTLHGKPKQEERAASVESGSEGIEVVAPQHTAADSETADQETALDFMNILTYSGRKEILRRFFVSMEIRLNIQLEVEKDVETDVEQLLGSNGSRRGHDQLKTHMERVLGVVGILAMHLLGLRNQNASLQDIDRILNRPWLRHLWWEGCMAYFLLDIIPIYERRGYYRLATNALEILLFGQLPARHPSNCIIPKTLAVKLYGKSCLAQAYLSRRARGKAFERLVIDYMHILRQQQKKIGMGAKLQERDKKRKLTSSKAEPTTNDITAGLCTDLINSCLPTGQITFCAARTLARRLKRPLAETLSSLDVYEIQELGHRLGPPTTTNSEDHDTTTKKDDVTKKFIDWSPITDFAVANALASDCSAVGGRCSFVGFEEQESLSGNFSSLNVEELALEFYNTGRLPVVQGNFDPSTVRGGWVGWHDEGGKLRALFRILSSPVVLRTDWGCPHLTMDDGTDANSTIHLTPYQGAPFDLHVGAEQGENSNHFQRGFYQRRRAVISKFLERLEEMSSIEVADLVFRSVETRVEYSRGMKQSDPLLERDILQARSLSALAAGFGGKMLAALCRCLFFDYRHYSGGLPDLTLFRAVYEKDETHKEESLVDLGAWIGEAFSPEQIAEKQAKRVSSMFEDQDEEFLGCSKVGDSGRRNSRNARLSNNRATGRRSDDGTASKSALKLPERVSFVHENRKVRVECMLVEVKSQNDRLDPRQEDWLNILDRFGNVRVCKFGAKPKKDRPRKKTKVAKEKKVEVNRMDAGETELSTNGKSPNQQQIS